MAGKLWFGAVTACYARGAIVERVAETALVEARTKEGVVNITNQSDSATTKTAVASAPSDPHLDRDLSYGRSHTEAHVRHDTLHSDHVTNTENAYALEKQVRTAADESPLLSGLGRHAVDFLRNELSVFGAFI